MTPRMHIVTSGSSKCTTRRMLTRITVLTILILVVCMFCIGTAAAKDIDSASELKNLFKKGGSGKLTADIEGYFTVKNEVTVDLDLNGHSITPQYSGKKTQAAITIRDGSTFRMYDSKGTGKISGRSIDQWTGRPGGVYVEKGATFIMSGGTISDCKSYSGKAGAGVLVKGTFEMNGGTITNCKSNTFGGGVYVDGGNFIMRGGTISNCVVESLDNEQNCLEFYGGGVYVKEGSFEMTGGTIKNCKAIAERYEDLDKGGGGVCVNDGYFKMSDNAKIENCYIECTDDTLESEINYMEGGGGGVCIIDSRFYMTNGAIITGCSCKGQKCGVFGGGGVFIGSKVHEDKRYEGSYFYMDKATITNCDVTSLPNDLSEEEYFDRHSGRGGAVYIDYASDPIIMKNSVISNSKGIYGGGICTDTGIELTLENMTFENCCAYDPRNPNCGYGGGLYVGVGTATTIKDCTFRNCMARAAGGAIYASCMELDECSVSEVDIVIEDCQFESNTCDRVGGALAICPVGGGTASIFNCNFNKNSAGYGGGAMIIGSSSWWMMPTQFQCLNSNFTSNTVTKENGHGGAAMVCMCGIVPELSTIAVCNFDNNEVQSGSGGAIYILNRYTEEDAPSIVEHPEIPAPQIILPPDSIKDLIINVVVAALNKFLEYAISEGQQPKDEEGRIYQMDQTLTISDSTFTNNKAAGEGGAIYGENSATTNNLYNNMAQTRYYISNSRFTGNEAKGTYGGAISVNQETSYKGKSSIVVDLISDTMTANSAKVTGGGVYLNPSYTTYSTDKNGNIMKIRENYVSSGKENNVYIPANKLLQTISGSELSAMSKIGVTTETKPASLADAVTFYKSDRDLSSAFFSDDSYYAVVAAKQDNIYNIQLVIANPAGEISNSTTGVKTQYNSLSAAIREVQPGETLTLLRDVAENIVVETTNPFTLDLAGYTLSQLNAEKPVLTINSGADVTITGNGIITEQAGESPDSTILIASDATVTIKKVSIVGNYGNMGGAINNAGMLTIDGTTFISNVAAFGAAVYNTGTLTVKSGTFSSNTASEGGAIYNLGTLRVDGGSLVANVANKGGAIYHGGSVFNLSGNPQMSGNINAYGEMSTIYLADAENRPITCDGLTSVNIGISSQKKVPQDITVPSSQDYSGCFVSDNILNWIESVEDDGKYIVRLNGTTFGSTYVTVSFDTLGISTAPESQNISRGSKASEPVPAPTASGYVFNQWCTDMDGLNAYDFSTVVYSPLVLYANWTKTWLVNYDMQGIGTAPDGYPQVVSNGTILPQPADPVANGYVFDNWMSDYQCTTQFDFSKPVVADTTIYAHWLKNCTVSYDMRGHGEQVPAQVVTEGDTVTQPENPTATGYVFDGWYNELSQPFDFANTTITDNTTISAHWTQIQFKVSFDTDGGDRIVNPQIIGYGGYVVEPNGVTRDSSILVGWKNGTKDWDFTVDQVYANMTLTAQWEAVDAQYHVTAANIANGTISVSTDLAKQGSTVNVTVVADEGAKITDLSLENKTGAKLSSGLSPQTYNHDTLWTASFLMPAEDVIVNATVLHVNVTVIFDGNGGTVSPTSVKVGYGDEVPEPIVNKTGSYLTGWKNTSTDVLWDFANDRAYDDMTLTAQWASSLAQQYNIILGSSANATIYRSAETAPAGATVNISIRADDGMKVSSWAVITESGNLVSITESKSSGNIVWNGSFTMPNENVTINGSAVPQVFVVTYDGNGGQVTPESANVSYGDRAPMPVASWDGHNLTGWKNGATVWDFATDKVVSDMTLTAQWNSFTPTTYYNITTSKIPVINNCSAGVIYCPVKSAPAGETVSFSISTSNLFDIVEKPTVTTISGESVLVNEITNTSKYWNGSFTMPASDVIIDATTKKVNMSVSAVVISGKGHGAFTVNASQVKAGEWVKFTAEPYGGYEVWNNTVYINTNPRDITSGSLDYQVGNTNVVSTLSFVSNVHTITRDTLEFGTRLIANKSIASPNESVMLVTVPGPKRNVSQFYYINTDTNVRTNITDISTLPSAVNSYVGSFSMPNADVIVGVDLNINLSANEHLVVKDPEVENGQILSLFYGATNASHYILTVPATGYAVKPESVTVTPVASNAEIPVTQLNTNQFAFTMPNTAVIISASFYETDQPASSTSSSHQSGATIVLPETAEPTPTPTASPTQAPVTPLTPTTQPTQSSPAPLAGLIVGLGAAALIYRLRR